MENKEQWVMPKWMEPYRYLITTGGENLEDAYRAYFNSDADEQMQFMAANWPQAIGASIDDQIRLLERLREQGLLK